MRSLFFTLLLIFTAIPVYAQTTEQPSQEKYQTYPAKEETLLEDKIYFFAHSMCQACRPAFVYLYENHADLHIGITDMKFPHNLELYKQCVKKFNVPNQELRLPLICMGNHHIMGWDETSATQFEEYLKDFTPAKP